MYNIKVSSDIKTVIIEEIISITLDVYSNKMIQGKKNNSASDIERNNELERRLNIEIKEMIFKKTGVNAFQQFKI